MSNVKGYLAARNRQNESKGDEAQPVEDPETSAVMAALQLVGMEAGSFSPSESQLVETWVMLGLVGVAPIVEEVFE